ncbi:MAG: thioredoxin family protein [Deferrisomatales bacterium]|nr:thioredoxin family protein [Deferrisomatales bacterium]
MHHALRIFALTLAAGLALAALAHAGPLEDAARESGKPLIVRFGLERCLQCIRQGQAFDALEPTVRGEMTFRFVHIGREEEMAGQYGVLLVPTVLFFDRAGSEMFRHVGYLDPAQLEAQLRKAGLLGAAAGG